MLFQILAHTPTWVFVLFALLVWLGARQLTATIVSLQRSISMSAAMAVLSLYGVLSVFSRLPVAALGWAAAAAFVGFLVLQRPVPAGTRYDAASRRFHLGASAVPLALMMGIFFTKYVVGVQVAMHPALAGDSAFAIGVGTLYGAFSGIFAGRGLRLWRLAQQQDRVAGATPSGAA